MFDNYVPRPTDLFKVPEAQKSVKLMKTKEGVTYNEFPAKLRRGLQYIERTKVIPPKSKTDLEKCINMMEEIQDMSFHWNINIYVNPEQPYAAHGDETEEDPVLRVPPAAPDAEPHAPGANRKRKRATTKKAKPGSVTPEYSKTCAYMVHVQEPPFWSLARSIYFFVLLKMVSVKEKTYGERSEF